jgi:hypothetical protein
MAIPKMFAIGFDHQRPLSNYFYKKFPPLCFWEPNNSWFMQYEGNNSGDHLNVHMFW